MQFRPHDEAPDGPEVRVFRHSRLGAFVLWLVFAAFTAGLGLALVFAPGRLPLWAKVLGAVPAIGFAGLLVVVNLVLWHAFRASLRASNWSMRLEGSTLWLPIRSWLNADFAPAPATAVGFGLRELHGARKLVRLSRARGDDDLRVTAILELELAEGVDLGPLREAIRVESRREGPEQRFLGVRSRSRAVDAPLRVVADDRLQMDWPGRRALAALKDRGVRWLEPRREREDGAPKSPAEADERILAHVERGEKLAAIALARGAYGMGLAEAKAFVEDLFEGADRAA